MDKSLIKFLHLKQGFGIMYMFRLESAIWKMGLQIAKIKNVLISSKKVAT